MSESTSTMAREDDRPPKENGEAGLLLSFALGIELPSRGVVLAESACVIGRDAGEGRLALPLPSVSRMHAVLQRKGDRVRIKDLGSRNGTFVCGERITERLLSAGDDVRIGDAIFVFVDHDARAHLRYRLDGTLEPGAAPIVIDGLAGGWSMARLSREVVAAARSDAAVLLLGETGVGKELVARGVHAASGRRGPFVAVNSAALAPNLIESAMFGHEKGAFTGADRRSDGLVRSAQGGTLFLDEIGDLDIDAQAKLLRTLESREVLPVGATRSSIVDVRIVCATHRDLPRLVHEGRFRADLYARIAGHTLRIPPLRDRKEDLTLLVRQLLARRGAADLRTSLAFMYRLHRHAWPFNVRELVNAVHHAVSRAGGGELGSQHLPEELGESPTGPAPSRGEIAAGSPIKARRMKSPERAELIALLREHEGNVSAVARALQRDAAQVYRWLHRHAIDPTEYR